MLSSPSQETRYHQQGINFREHEMDQSGSSKSNSSEQMNTTGDDSSDYPPESSDSSAEAKEGMIHTA